MIGLIAITVAGRASAARLAEAWPGETRAYDGPTRQALHRAWAECDGLVCFLAVGATTRLVARCWTANGSTRRGLRGRSGPVRGGSRRRARGRRQRVVRQGRRVLGAQAVITTATDAAGLPGWTLWAGPPRGAVARVSRALLDGEQVGFEADATWPLPALPSPSAGRACAGSW